jgi:hypothetical protein
MQQWDERIANPCDSRTLRLSSSHEEVVLIGRMRGKTIMTSNATGRWSVFFFFLAASYPLLGQGRSSHDVEQSCRSFVQGFYDWYVPRAVRAVNGSAAAPALDLALKQKSSEFGPEILRALREDSEAQAKTVGEIVGLDSDPFLNSQDPRDHYLVGNITPKGDRYWVEVYGMSLGKKGSEPDVVPELILKDGRWLFINFHYPNPSRPEFENLLSLLKSLRGNRQQHPK